MRLAPVTYLEERLSPDRDELPEESREDFDRLAFAMSALDLVAPEKMTVAVCRGSSRLRVEAGRSWGRGQGESWALVNIPPNASRRAIALALTELTARATRGMSTPRAYALDVLLAEGMSTPRAYALDVLLAEPRAEKR